VPAGLRYLPDRVTPPPVSETPVPRWRGAIALFVLFGVIASAVLVAPKPPPEIKPPEPPAPTRPEPIDAGPEPDAGGVAPTPLPYLELDGGTLEDQKEALVVNMQRSLRLADTQADAVRAILRSSERMGQGNPDVTRHPLTRAECLARRASAPRLWPADPRCGSPNMVPLYDPTAGERADAARTCIDQFEFPNITCEYPLVWARANEAAALCNAVGKRLCDAHEWEGACAGALKNAEREYAFGERRIMMQYLHNKDRELVWAYGKEKNHALCGTLAKKSPKCLAGGWHLCGTNDYPAGSFPECVSSLGVYDQHGNVAEHMNHPMKPEELGSRGGFGQTEMKGSWFIFAQAEAHEDDCRFRAPDWHASSIEDGNSHRNYHLGFRCCRDL
jgi:formylglycine-generating enzyme